MPPKPRRTSALAALDRATFFDYDAAGRLITTTNAPGGVIALAYDAAGRLTRASDANGRATHYAYDELGRLEAVTDPLGGQHAL